MKSLCYGLFMFVLALVALTPSDGLLREPDRDAKMQAYQAEHVPGKESPIVPRAPTHLRHLQNVSRPAVTTRPPAGNATHHPGPATSRAGVMYAYYFQRPNKGLTAPQAIRTLHGQGKWLTCG